MKDFTHFLSCRVLMKETSNNDCLFLPVALKPLIMKKCSATTDAGYLCDCGTSAQLNRTHLD